ncbi:MAG: hypothetical protein ABSA96_14045 [Candidatus Acidiferrales bacterium]|jgi:hypothetical protein
MRVKLSILVIVCVLALATIALGAGCPATMNCPIHHAQATFDGRVGQGTAQYRCPVGPHEVVIECQ